MPSTTSAAEPIGTASVSEVPTLYPLEQIGQRAREAATPSDTTPMGEEVSLQTEARAVQADLSLVLPPPSTVNADKFEVLQEYEGVVLSVSEDAFEVRLLNKTESSEPDEEAEIPLAEVSRGDRALVVEGAVFYWHIGYRDSTLGQRTRASVIRFRRLPAVDQEDTEAARASAKRLMEFFARVEGERGGQ